MTDKREQVKASCWERFLVSQGVKKEVEWFKYHNSGEIVCMWDSLFAGSVFDTQAKKRHPFKFFFLRTIPENLAFYLNPKYICTAVYRWFYYRVWERHHVVKLREAKPGYADYNDKLAMFIKQTLIDFIEIECASCFHFFYPEEYAQLKKTKWPKKYLGYKYVQNVIKELKGTKGNTKQRLAYEEFMRAYKFYTEELPVLKRKLDAIDDKVSKCDNVKKLDGHITKSMELQKEIADREKECIMGIVRYIDHLWL